MGPLTRSTDPCFPSLGCRDPQTTTAMFAVAPSLVFALALRAPAMRMRIGDVQAQAVPPPSLAQVLAGDGGLGFVSLAEDAQLTCVLLAAAGACGEVSKALHVLSLAPDSAAARGGGGAVNVQGETQKGMDVVANELFVSALTGCTPQ